MPLQPTTATELARLAIARDRAVVQLELSNQALSAAVLDATALGASVDEIEEVTGYTMLGLSDNAT